MHGVVGKPPGAAANAVATSKIMLLMLVAMTGVAPISLYMLVPALPVLATTFGGDISVAQMTVSLYMVGIACSQLIMGPLSDEYGRRPVLLAGLALMVAASIGCSLAQTLPQLIAARFLQALGGAAGMVVSRAIVRDLYSRDRISSMISRDHGICVSGRQPVLRPLRAAPFAGEIDLVRAGAAIRRCPAEPDLEHRRDQPGAALAVRHPDDRDGRQRLRDEQCRGRRHQRAARGRRHRRGRDGLSATGHRRTGLAIRRLSRRPLHHHAAADRGDLRALDRLRVLHVFPRAAAKRGVE